MSTLEIIVLILADLAIVALLVWATVGWIRQARRWRLPASAIALSVLLMAPVWYYIWGYPVVRGIETARRHRMSPHWMWLGVHPLLAWITFAGLRIAAGEPLLTGPFLRLKAAAPRRFEAVRDMIICIFGGGFSLGMIALLWGVGGLYISGLILLAIFAVAFLACIVRFIFNL